MVFLSVVVPVYNAGAYLSRCVESILAQNIEDMELILVDDGSTDDSGKLCDAYAGQDSRIRVIHQRNLGASVARNVGIDTACGVYLMFVDADDRIPIGFGAKCLDILKTSAVDLLCFGYAYVSMNGDVSPVIKNAIPGHKVLGADYIHSAILPPLLNLPVEVDTFIENYVYNKIYKIDLLHKQDIRFDEHRRVWEDRPFVVEYCKYAQSFAYIPEVGYHYIQTSGSLSTRYSAEKLAVILSNIRLYQRLYGEEYDLLCPSAVQYYCRNFIVWSRELAGFQEHYAETLSAIRSFCEDALAQTLFSEFVPDGKFETKIKEYVLNDAVETLFLILKKEQKRKLTEQKWKRSIWYRGYRKLCRMLQ